MVLSACGQTGPLYMPKPPARPAAAHTPAPAPAGTTNTTNSAAPAIQLTPPAPAAGVTIPVGGANDTQVPNQPTPATQQ
jgi:predicted small lipoprotein YifL